MLEISFLADALDRCTYSQIKVKLDWAKMCTSHLKLIWNKHKYHVGVMVVHLASQINMIKGLRNLKEPTFRALYKEFFFSEYRYHKILQWVYYYSVHVAYFLVIILLECKLSHYHVIIQNGSQHSSIVSSTCAQCPIPIHRSAWCSR